MTANAKEIARLVKSGLRPEGMSYALYASILTKAKIRPVDKDTFMKAEEEAEEEDEDEGDEDEGDDGDDPAAEEAEEEAEKSIRVGANALRKAINDYSVVESAVRGRGHGDRLTALQGKLAADTITKSERRELAALIAGDDDDDRPLRKSMADRIDDLDHESGKLVKANAFLTNLVESVDASLDAVSNQIAADTAGTRELIKSQGSLIKSLSAVTVQLAGVVDELRARLHDVESTPMPRRAVVTPNQSRVVNRGLAKSTLGSPGAVELTKADVLRGFDVLTQTAMQRGDTAAMQQLTHAVAKFESSGQISPQHAAAVQGALGGNFT